jgi:hypothetical protein
MDVVIGIDSHKETLAAAAIDELGKVAAVREFSNSPRGEAFLASAGRRGRGPQAA